MENNKPNPRDLDPKFKDAKANENEPEIVQNDDAQLNSNVQTDEEPMIVHQEMYMDGSVQKTRTHGPMPVKDWPKYEKENGL